MTSRPFLGSASVTSRPSDVENGRSATTRAGRGREGDEAGAQVVGHAHHGGVAVRARRGDGELDHRRAAQRVDLEEVRHPRAPRSSTTTRCRGCRRRCRCRCRARPSRAGRGSAAASPRLASSVSPIALWIANITPARSRSITSCDGTWGQNRPPIVAVLARDRSGRGGGSSRRGSARRATPAACRPGLASHAPLVVERVGPAEEVGARHAPSARR